MKTSTIILFIGLCVSHIFANTETITPPSILGKWKLTSSQFENEPLLPAWCSVIGEISFKSDGSFSSWIQAQSGDNGKIQPSIGTWELNGRNLVTLVDGNKYPESCTIDLDENRLIIKQHSPEHVELHYKRAIDDLGDSEIEGLKFDYRISFPTKWKVMLPESVSELPASAQVSFGKRKLTAIATSPDKNAVISLFVSSQKRRFENIDIKDSEHLSSLWIKTKDIDDNQWRLQKARNLRTPPGFDVYIASTYHQYKTVILNFEFLEEHSDAENMIYGVLNSYAVSERENEHGSELGKLIPHKCGEPIIYSFVDPHNPEVAVIHFLHDGDNCPRCGKTFKE